MPRAAHAAAVEPRGLRYWAFISYSHRDERVAKTLQRAIETYRVPKRLVGSSGPAGPVPSQLKPIFRDRDELQAGTDLKASVREALAQSRFLVVVCSPDAAQSPWVNQEIIEFKKLHGESRVLAVIARGEPFAGRSAGREAEECFPPALQSELTAAGLANGPALEPIAADVRAHGDGRRRGTLKLIAGMVGVGADELIRRDARRRMRRMTAVAVASLAGMAIMSVLAFTAVQSRNEARLQRNEAEELLEFMLGDLRRKLDPVGRLDVLDGVGEKALAYYERQDAGRLDANALGRRSRALHLIGQIREKRGQLDAAQAAFQRAAETTAQLLARTPEDGHRVFEHAQSVYWVGHLAWLRGHVADTEQAFGEYLRLAEKLVSLDPGRVEWQAELAYARGNVGVVFLSTDRSREALEIFARVREVWERITLMNPRHASDIATALGWIAKAHEALGDFDHAILAHEEKIAALQRVPNAATSQQVKRNLGVTQHELARLHLALGRIVAAEDFGRAAVQNAKALVAGDPQNKSWLEQQYLNQVLLAEAQLASGNRAQARENSQETLTGSAKLLALDPKVANWQVNLRGRVLAVAAQLATAEERPTLILDLQAYLLKIAEFAGGTISMNQTRDLVIAEAELALAHLLAREARYPAAATHARGVAARVQRYADAGSLPAMTLLAAAHAQLGDAADARALVERIDSSSYRHPRYAQLKQVLAGGSGTLAAPP